MKKEILEEIAKELHKKIDLFIEEFPELYQDEDKLLGRVTRCLREAEADEGNANKAFEAVILPYILIKYQEQDKGEV